jgi:hypothetical protein
VEKFILLNTISDIMADADSFDIRLVLKPDDELYPLFQKAKQYLGVKSNTEAARILLKKGVDWLVKTESISEDFIKQSN